MTMEATTTRRRLFNLRGFIEDLTLCIEDRPDDIDDVVQSYKDFLSHTRNPLLDSVKSYVNRHPLVTDNEEVRSYIVACHRLDFDK